jgi:YVTN family beta-propeller protein
MVTTTVAVGMFPNAVAITLDGSKAYIANISSNDISVINTSTNTVTVTIPVGMRPFALAITPATQPPIPCPSVPGAVAKTDVFLNETDHYILLQWCPSITFNVVNYLIFRDREQIGSVPSSGPLNFKDHERKKGETYIYDIVAVDSFGSQSAPLSFTVKVK